MKKLLSLALILVFLAATGSPVSATHNALHDTVIALDAGHGGDDLGAQYPANCASDETVD